MVTLTVGKGAEWGHVRAVFSRRLRGHAAPADLLRANLRGAALAAMRRRMAAAFGDYLVTEAVPVAWGKNRWRHNIYSQWMTGYLSLARPDQMQEWAREDDFEALDAPDYLAGGSCIPLIEINGFIYSRSSCVNRGSA